MRRTFVTTVVSLLVAARAEADAERSRFGRQGQYRPSSRMALVISSWLGRT